MRRISALLGGGLALAIVLAGCGDRSAQPDTQTDAPTSAAQTADETSEVTGDGEGLPTPAATETTPTVEPTLGVGQPTPAVIPTAVDLPTGSSEAAGGTLGSVPFTRTESIVIGANGALDAASIEVQAGETFTLSFANNGANDLLISVPLGGSGELGVLLPAAEQATSSTGAPDSQSTATADTGSSGGAPGTASTPPPGVTSTGGGTGGSSGGSTTDSAAAQPTTSTGSTPNNDTGTSDAGTDDTSAMEQMQGLTPPVTLLMRFTEPGTYTISCSAYTATAASGDQADSATAQPAEGTSSTGTPEATAEANSTGTPEATAEASSTGTPGTAGTEQPATGGGCSGTVTIVVR